jgi:hypothetical protein
MIDLREYKAYSSGGYDLIAYDDVAEAVTKTVVGTGEITVNRGEPTEETLVVLGFEDGTGLALRALNARVLMRAGKYTDAELVGLRTRLSQSKVTIRGNEAKYLKLEIVA